ncbi:gluconate 2-dehydrogenase subunit 3 family protein [Phocicoccus pinnipedialis]|uniref:Gluconate 2-dehydrogenase subunit 3 n=1 Tax=Phocicoccus pinnipedialis TaxID=110845 RepID=A0A6V7R5F9_9BACL|nr:gluconate 2-dehydrogenase subunit 3 family protein [Jeotgalicoccus pinnipedialis]MBP1939636.1 gluconate 2-dehydrogenase gamma chain [Jeotgalicoccus pinnipedialis]CAD2072258.1 Gluconate 2-dehydrogenase subunit 3 precursor [Jeotgalicoccus pinnipedialis]
MSNDEKRPHERNEKQFSRRDFLKTTGVATGGILAGSLLGGVVTHFGDSGLKDQEPNGEGGTNETPESQKGNLTDARVFFNRKSDFSTLAAAAERIFPEDDLGPGAISLGVPYFIDKQCHSWWGFNGKNYTDGPHDFEKTPEFGIQEKLNRGQIFKLGLEKMNEIANDEFDGNFWEIDSKDQDEILKKFESNDDDVKMNGVRADVFFSLLRDTTIWGVYADPAYGGNRDMEGWKMIEFPGPRMGWANIIQEEEFHKEAPQSLRTYQGGKM